MLLGQPAGAIVWGVLFFAERLSPVQWVGTGVVLAGIAIEAVGSAMQQSGSNAGPAIA